MTEEEDVGLSGNRRCRTTEQTRPIKIPADLCGGSSVSTDPLRQTSHSVTQTETKIKDTKDNQLATATGAFHDLKHPISLV